MNQYQNAERSRHLKTALPAALERAVTFQTEAAQASALRLAAQATG
jgi:hypothetical protein